MTGDVADAEVVGPRDGRLGIVSDKKASATIFQGQPSGLDSEKMPFLPDWLLLNG